MVAHALWDLREDRFAQQFRGISGQLQARRLRAGRETSPDRLAAEDRCRLVAEALSIDTPRWHDSGALDFDLALQPRVTFREVRTDRGRTYVVPDQLWRVDPLDCFASIDGLDARGEPRRFNLLDRGTRIEGYIWLLRRGDEAQLFKHLDAALLIDAWPAVAPRLSPELRGLWAPLVYAAGEAAIDRLLVRTLRGTSQDPALSPRRRKKLVERLKERGLSADDIRKLLR